MGESSVIGSIDFTQGRPLQLICKKMSIAARIIIAAKSTVQTIAQVFFSCKRSMYGYLNHGPASHQSLSGPAVLRFLLLKRLLHQLAPLSL
jgi:hypothetical protein